MVDKISEQNSQISKENSLCYDITEELKEKALKISHSLDECNLEKFVILSFQRSLILEDEEDNMIKKKKSSNGLNKNIEKIIVEQKSDNENKDKETPCDNIDLYDLKNPTDTNKNEAPNENIIGVSPIRKKKIIKNLDNNQETSSIDLLNSIKKTEKNSYFHINKKLIYSKLEKNTKQTTKINSDSNILPHISHNYLLNSNHNTNQSISPLLKSLSFNTSSSNFLKSKNNIENFSSIPQNLFHNKKSYNNDSLYNLFNSDCFDMHLIMFYLSVKDESTIIDVLVNIIYSKCINQSLFYIPQLCFLISNKKFYEAIENYVLDRCVDQIKFSLIAHWLLSSFIEHDDLQVVKKFDKFMQRVEMTLVNGRRATISNYRMFNSLNKKTDEDVVLNSLDKEFRLEYFDKTSKFYNDLKTMCEKLKKYPKEDKINLNLTRIGKLKSYLNRFNRKLRDLFQAVINQKNMHYNSINNVNNNLNLNNVANSNENKSNNSNSNSNKENGIGSEGSNVNNNLINNCNNNAAKEQQTLLDEKIMNYKFSSKSLTLFRGFILPFDDNVSTVDEYNTLIVNFLPEHSFCFSTKARVPVKLTVETIKVFEAEFWDDLIIKEEEKHSVNNENNEQDDGKSTSTRILQVNEGNKINKLNFSFIFII